MVWGSKVSASTASALTVTALTVCALTPYLLTVSALTDAASTFPVLTVSAPSVSVITVYAWASTVLVVHVMAVSGWSVYVQTVSELAVLFHIAVVLNKSVIRCMHANDIHRSQVPGHAAAYRARPGAQLQSRLRHNQDKQGKQRPRIHEHLSAHSSIYSMTARSPVPYKSPYQVTAPFATNAVANGALRVCNNWS